MKQNEEDLKLQQEFLELQNQLSKLKQKKKFEVGQDAPNQEDDFDEELEEQDLPEEDYDQENEISMRESHDDENLSIAYYGEE